MKEKVNHKNWNILSIFISLANTEINVIFLWYLFYISNLKYAHLVVKSSCFIEMNTAI